MFLLFIPVIHVHADNSIASNELSFINAIYNRYVGNVANYDAAYEPFFQTALSNNLLNIYFRELCTEVTVSALVRGTNLSASDKAVARLVRSYANSNFRSIGTDAWSWLAGAPAFDCLLAANTARHAIPQATRDGLLNDLAYFARGMYGVNTPDYYRTRWTNKGDTPAEEANAVATFLLAAAKLLPDTGAGAVTAGERNGFYAQGRDLLLFSYSQCNQGCGLQIGAWLVNNHQIAPNPNYTMSLLTAYSEAGMLFRQANETLPADIFTTTLRSSIAQTAQVLQQSYLSSSFGYQGPFNMIRRDGTVLSSFDFGQMRYTLRNPDTTYPINSSIPVDRIDSLNQFILAGTSTVKSYVFSGDKVWRYDCDVAANPVDCWVVYQNTPLSRHWQDFQRRAETNPGWGGIAPPSHVDAITQWYLPNTTQLKSYIWSGGSVWHYICDAGGCTAQYTQLLSQTWPTADRDAAGWTANPPPTDAVDAISQFITPGTTQLDTYILRGNRVWAYRCTGVGTAQLSCFARYTNDLTAFWNQIGGNWSGAGWSANRPPDSGVDSFNQYYSPDGQRLLAYITKGNRVWAYECASGACAPKYTQTLTDFFSPIRETYKWPFEANQGSGQLIGVTDWGMDATFQNSAFSTIHSFAPQYASMYTSLQAEQIRRNRQVNPPLPPVFDNGTWLNQDFRGYYPVHPLQALTDGWQDPDPNTGKKFPGWSPPNLNVTVNSHFWLNMLAAKNHAVAYLMMTDRRGLLARFGTDPTPTPIPGDLNNDRRVNVADLRAALSQSPLSIFTYNLVAGNYGRP